MMRNDGQRLKILLYLEYHEGSLHPVSYQLLQAACNLWEKKRPRIYGIVVGASVESASAQLHGYPLEAVYLYESEECFLPDIYTRVMIECIEVVTPSIVLIGGTREGRALAPGISTGLNTGLTANCTELQLRNSDDLVQIRPAYGGNLMAQIVTPKARPQIATVKLNQFPSLEPDSDSRRVPEFIFTAVTGRVSAVDILSMERLPDSTGDLHGSDVIVVAGRGVRSKGDLKLLTELAGRTGGVLAATRGVVEKGWISSRYQIGLSGHSVTPRVLITCGVSGSLQFRAGIRGAQRIIAINSDADAPIFSCADYAFCGDLYEIVPALSRRLGQHVSKAVR